MSCDKTKQWETDFLPLLVLTPRGAAPVKTTTGNSFPRNCQRFPPNYYQYWCQILVALLPLERTGLVFAGKGSTTSALLFPSSVVYLYQAAICSLLQRIDSGTSRLIGRAENHACVTLLHNLGPCALTP